MMMKKIKMLLKADLELWKHAHWNDSAKLQDKSYDYTSHYKLLSEAKKEVEEIETRLGENTKSKSIR